MKRIQKYFLFLLNLTIMASLCFAGQYSVSAQSLAQAKIEVVSPPLFPDLTWKDLGNVQKDVHVYDQILNLSGNMFEAVEIYQNGIPESVFDYYSAGNLESLGWNSVGRSSFESTYWHPSGRYLTVQIMDCPNSRTEYCVNVWQSVESSSLPSSVAPSPTGQLSAAPLSAPSVAALAALNKLTPTNPSTIALPANSYRVLTWTDAGIGSTDRYQYCIDDTNNSTCNSTWIERNSTYSGDGEFTLASGKTYYWQVRVRDANVYANSGSWWSFTVGASTAFAKITPTSGSTTGLPASTQYFLQWSALPGIASTDRYQYCIDETNNASCDSNNWITRDSLYSGISEFTLVSGKTYYWQVRARDANVYANSGGWWSFTISSNSIITSIRVPPADFNGDNKTDFAVFRPSDGTWHINGVGSFLYGQSGDIPVPADYNGDGKDDIAVFRPTNGTWYISGVGNFVYGKSGDIPVPGDYNGDGKDDIAVFRPTNSTWYLYGIGPRVYGTVGDIPVVADYNGDGTDDIAVFRPTNGTWYLYGIGPFVYGKAGDTPVPADYNGDGKADIAVFRPATDGTWYQYGIGTAAFGTVGDLPVVGDYNGDGKADIAIFRPANSTWYIYGVGPFIYGTVGDIPV